MAPTLSLRHATRAVFKVHYLFGPFNEVCCELSKNRALKGAAI